MCLSSCAATPKNSDVFNCELQERVWSYADSNLSATYPNLSLLFIWISLYMDFLRFSCKIVPQAGSTKALGVIIWIFTRPWTLRVSRHMEGLDADRAQCHFGKTRDDRVRNSHRGIMQSRNYPYTMPKYCFRSTNLHWVREGGGRISWIPLFSQAGLMSRSPIIPLETQRHWDYVSGCCFFCTIRAVLYRHFAYCSWLCACCSWPCWQGQEESYVNARPRWSPGASGVFQHLWGVGIAC